MSKPNKDDRVYIENRLDCIERIEDYTKFDKSAFMKSTMIQDAVIRNLQVMAESSQRLGKGIRQMQPHIAWRELSGFRNILVHDYLGVDLQTIWSVLELELPKLKSALLSIQAQLGEYDKHLTRANS